MYSRKGYMDETYEILGYLGSGSGGVIYKAYHKRLQKEVVLKKIKRKSRPANSTLTMSHYIYKASFEYNPQFGYAAAMSYVIFIMVAILSFVQMKVGDKR